MKLNDLNSKPEFVKTSSYIVELAAEDEDSTDSLIKTENCLDKQQGINVNFSITELPETKHRKVINDEKMEI